MKKLSVVLATRNEEDNIGRCLKAIKGIADEIIVIDEYSKDRTRAIAESYGAKVYLEPHHDNFHITKQKAIDKAKGDWILQLDADEVVTPELAKEIIETIQLCDTEILSRKQKDSKKQELFEKHSKLRNDVGTRDGEVAAFYIPRKNMFLGKPLTYAGVYPDPAIRLIKKGKARLPAKSVHEMMEVDGKALWLFNDMEHFDSPTLRRYFARLNRYTDLHAQELKERQVPKGLFGFIDYVFVKTIFTFVKLYFRHKGYKDGMRGFMWSMLSASHFPIAYFKYSTSY